MTISRKVKRILWVALATVIVCIMWVVVISFVCGLIDYLLPPEQTPAERFRDKGTIMIGHVEKIHLEQTNGKIIFA